MTELPKSVRDQLARAQFSTSSHPDADLLTAYGENSLGSVERQLVAEHIAVCAECRHVLFLAQPEIETGQAVTTATPVRRLRWMGWASAAAVLVVVGSAVIVQQEKVTNFETPAVVATESRGPKPQTVQQGQAATRDSLKKPARTLDKDAMVVAAPSPTFTAPPSENAKKVAAVELKQKEDALKYGGVVANETVQSSQSVAAPRQADSGPANSPNSVATDVLAAQDITPKAAPMQKARKAEAADSASSKTIFGYAQVAPAQPLTGRAHWRLSNAGALERSYVADQWQRVLADTGSSFRVVSVVGNLVWAGGDRGALYVSRDGGRQWAPVSIHTNASVVSIHFNDEQNGAIQASDGKTWKTSDGGNTWVAQ
jgi:hypothetical protein